ncbi:MAG: AAA family ATPase [Gammaproteobacteria bacterium]|nr:MAG: AAA family ATPase [Gammaproteobacteria bacterium]
MANSLKYNRLIDLSDISRKSLFLFGPRQTGKSTLLKSLYPDSPLVNLLMSDQFLKYQLNPRAFREEILTESNRLPIIVDEIQKLPILLDEIHYLIENHSYRFILTGSSARKLRRESSNLLAGRALERRLFPLVTREIGQYDINRIINFGSLPAIYDSPDPEEDLFSYVGSYLKEEIQQESNIRKLGPFANFLEQAALDNSELLNFANIASDVGVSANTVKEYYQILEDTLIGTFLPPFKRTIKRKAISKAKFYFFDVGVANILAKRLNIKPKSELYEKCLEHLVYVELKAWLSYSRNRQSLTFWRSINGQEVDFIIGNEIAIEVKSTTRVQGKHLKGIKALAEEVPLTHKIIISLDNKKRIMDDNFIIYPVKDFFAELWANKIF